MNFNGVKNAGKDLVCFEYVRLKGKLAAKHDDINSKEQTVHVNDIGKIVISDSNRYGGNVNTGDNNHILFMLIVFLLATGALVYVVIHNKKDKNKNI